MTFSARLHRVLLGTGGAASLIPTVLLLSTGVVLTFNGIHDIRLAVASVPQRMPCQTFIDAPQTARWVTLTGCRLDLNAATTRRWRGWWNRTDGGSSTRHLELFIPLSAVGSPQPETPRVVLATMDPKVLSLVETIDRLPPEDVDAFIDTNAAHIESVLAPPELSASVAAFTAWGARPALRSLLAEDAVVLEQGREPQRVQSLCSLLLGLSLMLFALWPVARRIQLERELEGLKPPPRP
jgi:hypothetical protein